jgi:formylglycine-generating enzyme required for sulfatase activity
MIIILIAIVILLAGCYSAEIEDKSPASSNITPQELIITPTSTDYKDHIHTRSADRMNMVFVPGGTFHMGSTAAEVDQALTFCQQHYPICNRWYYERESPQHAVSLESFWIDQAEISNAQYRRCVAEGVCPKPSTCKKGEPTYDNPVKADHPVICTSWDEAQTYCHWVGARLPTEAEWEYAFRGSKGAIYPWGDEFDGSKVNYCDKNCSQSHADEQFDDGYAQTAPTGSYSAGVSWSGALNMSGNVSEWVADWLGGYSPEQISNPLGPTSGSEKIVKGCSWFFPAVYCRGTTRASVDPKTRFDYLGFRCMTPATQETEVGNERKSDAIIIPSGVPPTLDGSLSPGEWDDASIKSFANGSELFLKHTRNDLYLGLRSNKPGMIAGNVFVHHGDQIAILHTSAALGTAIYQQGENEWVQTQDFTWRCRDTGRGETALAEREAFLQQEGWLAANSRMGTAEELEYLIKLEGNDLHLAVNFIHAADTNEKIPWPADLEDDVIKPSSGGLPDNLHFSPELWGKLQVSP